MADTGMDSDTHVTNPDVISPACDIRYDERASPPIPPVGDRHLIGAASAIHAVKARMLAQIKSEAAPPPVMRHYFTTTSSAASRAAASQRHALDVGTAPHPRDDSKQTIPSTATPAAPPAVLQGGALTMDRLAAEQAALAKFVRPQDYLRRGAAARSALAGVLTTTHLARTEGARCTTTGSAAGVLSPEAGGEVVASAAAATQHLLLSAEPSVLTWDTEGNAAARLSSTVAPTPTTIAVATVTNNSAAPCRIRVTGPRASDHFRLLRVEWPGAARTSSGTVGAASSSSAAQLSTSSSREHRDPPTRGVDLPGMYFTTPSSLAFAASLRGGPATTSSAAATTKGAGTGTGGCGRGGAAGTPLTTSLLAPGLSIWLWVECVANFTSTSTTAASTSTTMTGRAVGSRGGRPTGGSQSGGHGSHSSQVGKSPEGIADRIIVRSSTGGEVEIALQVQGGSKGRCGSIGAGGGASGLSASPGEAGADATAADTAEVPAVLPPKEGSTEAVEAVAAAVAEAVLSMSAATEEAAVSHADEPREGAAEAEAEAEAEAAAATGSVVALVDNSEAPGEVVAASAMAHAVLVDA